MRAIASHSQWHSVICDPLVKPAIRAALSGCVLLVVGACGDRGRMAEAPKAADGARGDGGSAPTVIFDIGGKAWLRDPPIENPSAATVLSDGNVLVADAGSLSLRLFSHKGELLRTIGREGAGPGEFQSLPWAHQCAPDSVFVWDPGLGRVSVFDREGRYAREFRLPGRPGLVECATSGLMAAIMQPENLRRPDPNGNAPRFQASMVFMDNRGQTTATLGDVPAFENRPGGKRTRIAVGDDRVYLGTQDSAYVVPLGKDGEALPALPVGVAGRKTTPKAYEHAIGLLARQLVVTTEREAYRQSMLKIPMPPELPPYFELFADTAGTLWAQTSVPGDGATVLARVSATGQALTEVRLPMELRVFEVGTDYVLGAYEDSNDNPHVVLYRVSSS